MISKITKKDVELIYQELNVIEKEKLMNSTFLITGFAGSLGYTLLNFFNEFSEELKIKKVYGVDNYVFGRPEWIDEVSKNPIFDLKNLDITNCELDFLSEVDYIFHMASLASPVYYRKFPIETIDADVLGLRRLLDYYKEKDIKGFLFYSTSEIYGDPIEGQVPTSESYWGNVNTCGPRACYDESKRFGETLCYNFYNKFNMPIRIVRPFNNYGPGMRLNDQRVVADFAKAVVENKDIILYSNGKATRTFDYIPDATVGYLKCILHDEFDIFNIGSDEREITILELADIYKSIGKELVSYSGQIKFEVHEDKEYLTDNPQRRCPNIEKARKILGFEPKMKLEDGIKRYLQFVIDNEGCI